MFKRFLGLFLLLSAVVLFGACSLKKTSAPVANNADQGIVFYYSYSCPHCKIVEQYMAENKVEEKIKITSKEINADKTAQSEIMNHAVFCKMDQSNLGVPFLWTGEKCFMGDTDIINFFKEKLNEKK
jgi:glutaredoxin